jgi:hypothetical protein
MATGMVIGVAMALVLSGQFTGAKRGAEPGSSGGHLSVWRISTLVCIVAIATAAIVFYSSKRAVPPGAVSFDGSGVVLVPGADWQPTDARSSLRMVCRPVLKGADGSIIKVYAPRDGTDAQSGVALLRSQAAAMPGVWQDSFKQEDFTSDSGIRGIHLSYECSDPQHPERKVTSKLRTHHYLFHNKAGSCVVIFYLTPADRDSDTVHQMIRKTLILE